MADVEIDSVDKRGVALAQAEAMDRASRGAWAPGASTVSTGTPAQDYRALTVASYRVCAELGAEPPVRLVYVGETGVADWRLEIGDVDGQKYPTDDHARAAVGILATLRVFADRQIDRDPTSKPKTGAHYVDGVSVASDAGAWPVAAIVTVVILGSLLVGGAVYVACSKSDTVVDRDLARNANGQLALKSHADLLALATSHAAAERAAGHPLPFSDAEKAALAAILQTHGEALSRLRDEKPAPPPKNPTGVGEAIGGVAALAIVGGLLLTAGSKE
jgi:hypothetical protein